MNIKVKVANFMALAVFGLLTYLMLDASIHGSVDTFGYLLVPMFFSLLACAGFVVGFFAYGNGGEK